LRAGGRGREGEGANAVDDEARGIGVATPGWFVETRETENSGQSFVIAK